MVSNGRIELEAISELAITIGFTPSSGPDLMAAKVATAVDSLFRDAALLESSALLLAQSASRKPVREESRVSLNAAGDRRIMGNTH